MIKLTKKEDKAVQALANAYNVSPYLYYGFPTEAYVLSVRVVVILQRRNIEHYKTQVMFYSLDDVVKIYDKWSKDEESLKEAFWEDLEEIETVGYEAEESR